MVQKLPPPPPIANADPAFNRWLVEITAILSSGGGIDTNQIAGFSALRNTVATHATQISSLTSRVTIAEGSISALTSRVTTAEGSISALQGSVASLSTRSQVLNGTAAPSAGTGANGDWFADTTAKHIYVKVSGSWVLVV